MGWTCITTSARAFCFAAVLLLTGCATNTMTGRGQMSLISDAAVSQQSLSYYSAMVGDYTSFIEKFKASDDEIAQVMGHEIGHALAFVNRPNDRLTEQEANSIGIELAARAGYGPAAGVTLWDKMGQLSGNKRAHFLSTHPSSEQRAQTLNDMQAPMRKFQTRALEAQAGQAPRQGHANKHGHGYEHDWLNAPKASRPAIDESKAIALYSPRLEDFEMGRIELKGRIGLEG